MALEFLARRPQFRPLPRLLSRQIHRSSSSSSQNSSRNGSSSAGASSSSQSRPIDSRWLSTIKSRIGRCITFGLRPDQIAFAGNIHQQLVQHWRELVAGSEGFLTDREWQGLRGHNVVWGEMDVMGHVNNVAYVRYAETGRINYINNFGIFHDPAHRDEWFGLLGSKGIGLILRSIKIDYKFPMTSPDKISVYHKLSHPPHEPSSSPSQSPSSLHFDVIILSEAKQRAAARCVEDVVVYDYRVARKVDALPSYMLTQLRRAWDLQEVAKRVNARRIAEIEAMVRELEKGSWDRPDAVEDMGSAAPAQAVDPDKYFADKKT